MSAGLDNNRPAPAGAKPRHRVCGHVTRSSLPAVLIELVYLRVSQINNCDYCCDVHRHGLLKKGLMAEKLGFLQAWRKAGRLFDERERAALAWAETLTRVAKTSVPKEAYEAVCAVFNESEIVDLTIAASLMNSYSRKAAGCTHRPLSTELYEGIVP